MTEAIRLVGLCGSLRKGSLNRRALELAGSVLPAGVTLDIVDWRDIPPFDADVYAQGPNPQVQALAERIRQADGVVIATPEYNFSIPGSFKNVIDWLSRGDNQPFARKPVAILSAATGPLGGARVQYDLRRVMLFVNAMVLVKPEVFIGVAQNKFDAEGQCTDEATRNFVTQQMLSFETWIQECRRMRAG
jgi:chromate reductase